ncbi:S1 family peptidase [Conexibacter woesei]|uniref:Peptidase S1 and S6 chymotrypsin/Hap n=1 Tax=Conexibacter woesei (strain DSM 14684 / CCUG 47730 / CIP 108061 / JCM 11494 / NBRC 100937 / ID131577) TaxID=469383 RepID=D3FBS8_CONWI|nr:serine protease [Conexibacter woesei]ADB51343.1 peptidase S1 and S6 chymotrypsin/Hap [Conexibacter woesei DSM 14684]
MNWTPTTRLFATALALTALFALPSAAFAAERGGATLRVAGGTQAQAGAPFTSLAYLTIQKSSDSAVACSGTVVAPAVVLTAAHCVTDSAGNIVPADGVQVTTGRLVPDDASGGQQVGVSRIVVHPGYDRAAVRADVALVLLSASVDAPPLALGAASDAAPGTRATIAGWGATSGQDSTPSPVLMTAPTTVFTDDACGRLLGERYDAVTMLCAADEPAYAGSTCLGDSGGPLLVRRPDGTDVQVAVTSWGSTTCDARVPQAFARISALSGWITGQIAAAPQLGPPAAASSGIGTAAVAGGTQPRGGSPAMRARAASSDATYRGRTRQRQAISVELASGSPLRVRVGYRVSGSRGATTGMFSSTTQTRRSGRSTTPGRSARSFSVTLRDARGRRALVRGTVSGRRLSGSVRLSWRRRGGATERIVTKYTARNAG